MPRQLKDEYEIISEIGSGGMATVYKAVQKSLDRPVAIKELKKSYHADEQIVQRFERESKMAASLQHENIVHIYDYWKRPAYSIVMEYVDGTDLADVIEKTGALPIDVGIMIAIQVCSALEYAHMRGLVHRDIKPSNIMIKRNGEVKLMDFGIAQSRNLESLTMPGTLIGTPAYMSPEQVLGQHLDARSDIFSFGIVLYEMLTGRKPFTDDETRAVSAKIMKDKVLSPRRINRDIPWRLQWLIKKCLRKKPQRRYRSMLEVEKTLGKRLAGRTTKAASLRRSSDYLVSMNVLKASPEDKTEIIAAGAPLPGFLRKIIVAVGMVLLLAAGAAVYYVREKAMQLPLHAPDVPAVLQPAGSPVTTSPQTAVTGSPAVPSAASFPSTSLSSAVVLTTETSTVSIQSAPSRTTVSAGHDTEQAAQARKKTGKGDKKQNKKNKTSKTDKTKIDQ